MFGLAQLYQLRGRIGRSKIRGYAYLTLPPKRKLAASALKRLEVMQSLDTLGAGFTLASHDLDIRGAGNLLGDEQSGHIKEVGVELYQQMLEEAVAEAKSAGDIEDQVADKWSPQIDIGVPVLIPSDYVPDLGIRLSLYRRIADLTDRAEIDGFAAEMIDRFGSLPEEVENLLETVAIKRLCLAAGVDKVDAGSKGAVISFRNNEFNNPAGLVEFITSQVGTSKLRPDHKLVFMRSWGEASERLSGVQYLMKELSDIAA
jgi:transcription-repair coupling factor (superfamily II helicase)